MWVFFADSLSRAGWPWAKLFCSQSFLCTFSSLWLCPLQHPQWSDFTGSFCLLLSRDRQFLRCLPIVEIQSILALLTLCLLFEAAGYLNIWEQSGMLNLTKDHHLHRPCTNIPGPRILWFLCAPHKLCLILFLWLYTDDCPVTDNQILKVINWEPSTYVSHVLHATH